MKHLLDHAGDYFGIDPRQLVWNSRKGHIVRARHICFYVLRKRFGMSYPLIGKLMHRDHATVIHAVEKIWRAVETDMAMAAAIDHLMTVEPCSRAFPVWLKHLDREPIPGKGTPPPGKAPGPRTVKIPDLQLSRLRNRFDNTDDIFTDAARTETGIKRGSDAILAALQAV